MKVCRMSDRKQCRRKEIVWEDPTIVVSVGHRARGVDFLTAIQLGKLPLPPVMSLLAMVFNQISNGQVTIDYVPHESQYNPLGSVHGGIIATLLDSVMSCAVHTTLPAQRGYSTLEIKIYYARPVTLERPPLRATGRVLHVGRRTATAEGFLRDNAQRMYAHGTSTCLLIDHAT